MDALLFFGLCLSTCLVGAQNIPRLAQVIDQKSFNVLKQVPPPAEANLSTVFVPPGLTAQSAFAKPFHVYDDAFYDILGSNPTLTLIASSEEDPIFHEAVVWYKPTDEVFFAQNAGAKDAGTGLNKSSIIQKVSLANATNVMDMRNATPPLKVEVVDSNPMVINPNGATNYRGQLLFTGEGQGSETEPALFILNPHPPYNTTKLLNNYFGRQFNSLNDVAIHPGSKDVYFTDPLYGYLQDFRPAPGLRKQVYRLKPDTGAVTAVADHLSEPNGLTFSPDGKHAYVADTGAQLSFYGLNLTEPASIYRFDVADDGSFANRRLFAYPSPGVPDGVHCDSDGNLYAGCGDGVQVFSPAGVLLGKIFLGTTSANFNFAGHGRMVICAETELYLATIAAEGAFVGGQ